MTAAKKDETDTANPELEAEKKARVVAESALEGVRAEVEEKDKAISDLTAQLAEATSARETLEGELADARKTADDAENRAADAESALADAKDAADKARDDLAKLKKEGAVSRKPKSEKARRIGPMDAATKDGEGRNLLLDLLNSEAHEVVFSDGKQEVTALAPLRIGGTSWAKGPAGVVMTEPVRVRPDRPVTLAGFGLVDDSGKQIAWCAMPQPLEIGAGQEVKLDRQIVFA